MQIDAVVFDIGNVLIEWHPERFYDSVIGETRRRHLFKTVALYDMNESVDLGKPLKHATHELAAQHPDLVDEITLWHSNWIDMATPAIDRSVRLLRALRHKDIRVFALTNFGKDTLDTATARYPFLAEFDQRFVSGDLELIKPDPAIYAVLEETTKINPRHLLFTDDRPENITTAQTRGWQTHLFDGAAGWAHTLVQHGLLTESEAT